VLQHRGAPVETTLVPVPRAFVSLLVLAIGVAGVVISTGATGATATPVVLTTAQAQGALLTLDDMPSDWVALTPLDGAGTGFCGSPDARGRAQAAGSTTNAEIEFAGDQNLGPFVENDLFAFRSPVAARQFVRATARAQVACRHMDSTDPNTGASLSTDFSSLTLPQLGDGVYAFHSETTTVLGSDHEHGMDDVAYLRRGNIVSVVGLTAADSNPEILTEFLHRALRRINGAERAAAVGATATTVPSTTSTASCARAIADIAAPAPAGGRDPIGVLRSHDLAALPVPEAAGEHVVGLNRYITVAMYLDGTPVADRATWQDAMTRDGFVVGEATGYDGSFGSYGAEALQFASPEQALDFARTTMTATCASGTVVQIDAATELPAAVVYRSSQRGSLPIG
jgi:hypothetical protein